MCAGDYDGLSAMASKHISCNSMHTMLILLKTYKVLVNVVHIKDGDKWIFIYK